MRSFRQIRGACLEQVLAPGDSPGGDGVDLHPFRNDWRLVFDQGVLVIQNPFSLRCESDEPVSFDSMIGCVVTDAYALQEQFTLIFEANLVLSVSLKEEDYASACAALFLGPQAEVLFDIGPGDSSI